MSVVNSFARFAGGMAWLANARMLFAVLVCCHSAVAMALDCKLLDEKSRRAGWFNHTSRDG